MMLQWQLFGSIGEHRAEPVTLHQPLAKVDVPAISKNSEMHNVQDPSLSLVWKSLSFPGSRTDGFKNTTLPNKNWLQFCAWALKQIQ
jgi:hypothetical protein